MINIVDMVYDKVKSVISEWNKDMYFISFFVKMVETEDKTNFEFLIGYELLCEYSSYDMIFTSLHETIINTNCSDILTKSLYQWYGENGIENLGFEEDTDDLYDIRGAYIGKGPTGYHELTDIVAEVAEKLQKENFLKDKFGKAIPIIVHGLEYKNRHTNVFLGYTLHDIEMTKKANPNCEADDFISWNEENFGKLMNITTANLSGVNGDISLSDTDD